MIKCTACSKVIKSKLRNVRFCTICKEPVCFSCSMDGVCKDCHSSTGEEVNIYFKEKYGVKSE